jgi:hypothetical protein
MAYLINIKIVGKYAYFNLSNRPDLKCICDVEDLHHLESGSWYIHKSKGNKNARYYIRRSQRVKKECGKITTKTYHLHRQVISAGEYCPKKVVDHINGDSLDCRKENLRVVTSRDNILNSEKRRNGELGDFFFYRGYTVCNRLAKVEYLSKKTKTKRVSYYKRYYTQKDGWSVERKTAEQVKRLIDQRIEAKKVF